MFSASQKKEKKNLGTKGTNPTPHTPGLDEEGKKKGKATTGSARPLYLHLYCLVAGKKKGGGDLKKGKRVELFFFLLMMQGRKGRKREEITQLFFAVFLAVLFLFGVWRH